MNREDIICMAREAGWDAHHAQFDTRFQTFAALVASAEREASVGALSALNDTYELKLRKAIADEREACAKVCDEYDVAEDVNSCDTAEGIAIAIRARGQA